MQTPGANAIYWKIFIFVRNISIVGNVLLSFCLWIAYQSYLDWKSNINKVYKVIVLITERYSIYSSGRSREEGFVVYRTPSFFWSINAFEWGCEVRNPLLKMAGFPLFSINCFDYQNIKTLPSTILLKYS